MVKRIKILLYAHAFPEKKEPPLSKTHSFRTGKFMLSLGRFYPL